MFRFIGGSRSRAWLVVFGTLLALAGLAFAYFDTSRITPVYTRHTLYLLTPGIAIRSEGIQQTQWSQDGKYLWIARRLGPKPVKTFGDVLDAITTEYQPNQFEGISLEVFDVERGETRQIWQGSETDLGEIVPVGVHSAAVLIESPVDVNHPDTGDHLSSLMFADAKTGSWKFLHDFTSMKGSASLSSSPNMKSVILLQAEMPDNVAPVATGPDGVTPGKAADDRQTNVALFDSEGNPLGRWQVPYAIYAFMPEWGQDGRHFFIGTRSRKQKAAEYFAFEDGGKVTKLAKAPALYEETQHEPKFELMEVPYTPKDVNSHGTVTSLFLRALDRRRPKYLLVAAGGNSPSMAPTEDAFTYRVDGQLKIARIVKPGPEILASIKKALRKRALSDAKQAGLALIMYANDYDDILPGAGQKDSVDPYLKNNDILNGFSYTPPANLNMTEIAEPASTIIGYVEGPDGRAAVYSDGHAKWIENSGDDDEP